MSASVPKQIVDDRSLPPRIKLLLPAITSAFLSLLLYFPILSHSFLYDGVAIAGDKRLSDPSFGLTVWVSQWWPRGASVPISRPLAQFTYWLQVQLGLRTPMWFHLFDMLLYAGLCAIVALLARQLVSYCTPSKAAKSTAPASLASWIVALGFAVHPLHVEVVCSTVGRADTLGLLFTVVGIMLYLKWRPVPATQPIALGWRRASLIALCVLLAGLSKETGYLLAPMLVLIELSLRWIEHRLHPIPQWLNAGLWRVAVCISVVVLLAVAQRYVMSHNIPEDAFRGGLSDIDNPLADPTISKHDRFVTSFKLIGQAARLTAWPLEIARPQSPPFLPANSPDYSPRVLMPTADWSQPLVTTGLLVCAAWFMLLLFAARKRSLLLIPLLCLPVVWFIASNMFFLIGTIFAERLLMPLSLIALLLVGLLLALAGSHIRIITFAAMGILIALWAAATFLYVPAWQNNATLQAYTISYHPDSGRFQSFFANSVLDTALAVKDNPSLKSQLLDVAAEHAKIAIECWPRNSTPYAILGVVESERGNTAEAKKYFDFANNNSIDSHVGEWYQRHIGQLVGLDTLQSQADQLQKRVDAGESDPKLFADLGQTYVTLRKWPLAVKQFDKLDLAQITDHKLLQAYIDAMINIGNGKQALAAEEHYMTLQPDQWSILTDAAVIAIAQNTKLDHAKAWLDRAIELNPGASEPWAGLSNWYELKGDKANAIAAMQQALDRSSPDDPRYPHYQMMLNNLRK